MVAVEESPPAGWKECSIKALPVAVSDLGAMMYLLYSLWFLVYFSNP